MTASINPTVTYKTVQIKTPTFGKGQMEGTPKTTSKTIAVCSAAANETEANLFQKSATTIYNTKKADFVSKLSYPQWASYHLGGYNQDLKFLAKAADQEACTNLANQKAKIEIEGGK